MKCKDISNGYIELKCVDCGDIKKVGFTCKSRFCTSCGKVHVDNWVNGMLGKLINVKHRHMVFTIPESRIIAYDGKSVTFKYKRHEDNKEIIEKVSVFEFIKKVIIHIPDKNFKMVRYFGLYSRRCKDKDKFISEGKEKLENILEIYAIAKGVLYGKIKPTTT